MTSERCHDLFTRWALEKNHCDLQERTQKDAIYRCMNKDSGKISLILFARIATQIIDDDCVFLLTLLVEVCRVQWSP